MTLKVEKRIKTIAMVFPIIVLMVGLFITGIQTIDVLNTTVRTVESNSLRIEEVEKESKSQDQAIRNELIQANDMTKTQLADIQVSVAIANTNIQYLVKQYDKDKYNY